MSGPGPLERVRPIVRTRQIREFTPEALTDEELTALTDAARWSGSSRNGQPWRFIVIRDREMLRRVHDAGAPHTRSLRTAPAAIAIVMPGDPNDLEHAYDEGRVAERLLVAASMLELGAGVAWLRAESRPAVSDVVGLPGDRWVRTIVSVGHPSEAALRPKSALGTARLPAFETVLTERWPQG
jgi:nitroreductase